MRAFLDRYGMLIAGAVFALAVLREVRRGRQLRTAQRKARELLLPPLSDAQVKRITRKVMQGVDAWEKDRATARERLGRVRWLVKRDVA